MLSISHHTPQSLSNMRHTIQYSSVFFFFYFWLLLVFGMGCFAWTNKRSKHSHMRNRSFRYTTSICYQCSSVFFSISKPTHMCETSGAHVFVFVFACAHPCIRCVVSINQRYIRNCRTVQFRIFEMSLWLRRTTVNVICNKNSQHTWAKTASNVKFSPHEWIKTKTFQRFWVFVVVVVVVSMVGARAREIPQIDTTQPIFWSNRHRSGVDGGKKPTSVRTLTLCFQESKSQQRQ